MSATELQHRAVLLDGYLRQDPGNALLRRELVDLLIRIGRLDEARQHVQQALRQNPGDAPSCYQLAVIEHHSGHLPEARDLLAALLEKGVDAPGVRFELARVQSAQADFHSCAQTLDELSQQVLSEDLAVQVAFLHVRTLHRLGDLDLAIQRAERFLQMKPDTPVLVSALATLYLDAERLDEATRLFRAAEESHSLNSEMLAVGGFIALDGMDLAVAQQRFEQSVARSTDSGRACLGLGLVHAAAGRLGPAQEALAEATRKMPTHLGSWHALAWMQLLDKQVDAAESSFKEALAIDRNFGDTYGGLAVIAALRGERPLAEEHIRTGRRLDPSSLNVGMARNLLQHGGAMNTNEFLDSALKMLHTNALSKNPAMRASFDKMLGARLAGHKPR